MITTKIISIEPQAIVATGERYLDVAVELTDTDLKKPLLRKFGFPIDTSKEEIRAAVKKFAGTYKLEKVQSADDKIVIAQDAHVAELQDLAGEEIAAPDVDVHGTPKKGAKKSNERSKNTTKKGK